MKKVQLEHGELLMVDNAHRFYGWPYFTDCSAEILLTERLVKKIKEKLDD